MTHLSDLNPNILNVSYHQLTYYLKSHGWLHKRTIGEYDLFIFEADDKSCQILIPKDDQCETYKHCLVNILFILQYRQSPSLEDISWQIKKFCLDFVTQEQSYE